MNGLGIELSEPVLADYQAAFARFLQTWPDSAYLRQVPFPSDDPDEMRAVLDSFEGPSAEQRAAVSQMANQVQSGRVPLAVIAALFSKTYTETLIQRAVGPLVAMAPHDTLVGVETARAALDSDVVADLSVLHVVAELVDDQADLTTVVDVAHRQVSITEAVARDVSLGADALGRSLAGTWVPSADGNPGYFSPVSEAERARVARCVAQLQQQVTKHRTVPTPAVVTVFGEREHDADLSVWDRTIQLAHERRQPLWADDAVTRALARDSGVAAFSTLDLLTVLSERRRLTSTQLQQAQQTMLERGIADVPLTADMLRRAAVAADWQTGYSGLALARPEAWKDPNDTVQTWIAFIRSASAEQYVRLPSWTHVATLGAARTPYVVGTTAARTIIAQIISTVVFLTADHPTIVAGCIEGATEAIKASGVVIDDPVALAVQLLRDTLSKYLPAEQVAAYLLATFSACPETVQSVVRRSLLQ
jgi:hypothetical protein